MKIQMSNSLSLVLMAVLGLMLQNGSAFSPVKLTTTSSVKGASVKDVHSFLASPQNWPKITTSSHSVETAEGTKRSFDLGKPVPVNQSVKEVFGLPPILAPSVTWKCIQSNAKQGRLEFFSNEGLPGVLSNARLLYDIQGEGDSASVKLDVSFDPSSAFGVLAQIPLKIENTIAMKVLLAQSLAKQQA